MAELTDHAIGAGRLDLDQRILDAQRQTIAGEIEERFHNFPWVQASGG
jgi:hypothetical protein